METELKVLKQQNIDLMYQIDTIKKTLDNVYKYWLFDANKYNDLKEENKKLKEDYNILLTEFNKLNKFYMENHLS